MKFDINSFVSLSVNPAMDAVDLTTMHAVENTIVYSFNVVKGTVKKQPVNLMLPRINPDKFRDGFVRAWYALEYNKVMADAKAYADKVDKAINAETEVDGEVFSVLTEEDKHLLHVYSDIVNDNKNTILSAIDGKKAVKLSATPYTARIFVSAVRRESFDNDTEKLFADVYGAIHESRDVIKKAERSKDIDVNARVKILREKLDVVVRGLWHEHAHVVAPYVCHVNARFATEVFQAMYRGMKVSSKGNIVRVNAKDKDIAREVIFQLFKTLSDKEVKARWEAELLEHDEQLAKAMGIKVKPADKKPADKPADKKPASKPADK